MFGSYIQGSSLVQLTHVFAQLRCKASAISLRTAAPMCSGQKIRLFCPKSTITTQRKNAPLVSALAFCVFVDLLHNVHG